MKSTIRYLSIDAQATGGVDERRLKVDITDGVTDPNVKRCQCSKQCGLHPSLRCNDRALYMAKLGGAVAIAVCSECAKAIVARAIAALLG